MPSCFSRSSSHLVSCFDEQRIFLQQFLVGELYPTNALEKNTLEDVGWLLVYSGGQNPVLLGFICVSQIGVWGTGIPVQIGSA